MAAQFAGAAVRRDISSKPLLQHTEGNRSHPGAQSAPCFARTWRCASAAPSSGHGDVTLLKQTQRRAHAAQAAAVATVTAAPRCWHADCCDGANHVPAAACFATSIRTPRARAVAEVGGHAAAGHFFARQLHSTADCTTGPDRPAASSAPDEHGWSLEYQGTVSTTIQTLKAVSITTAGMALLGCPPYLYFTLDGTYTALKVLSAVGFSSFGVFTTGLLQWFVGPYVHKLWYNEGRGTVKVQILSLFAQPRLLEFRLDEVQAPDSIAPLQTFQAAGRVLYIDDATFSNKELLQALTPSTPFDLQQNEEGGSAGDTEAPQATSAKPRDDGVPPVK